MVPLVHLNLIERIEEECEYDARGERPRVRARGATAQGEGEGGPRPKGGDQEITD